eukprot:GHVP01042214.1.p1 GENE.GHVP01042214.1~~GHVP01042214.1.p1  ORF type:complete len:474 (+),score=84.52 GHVP01042214.1:989-2410(+)
MRLKELEKYVEEMRISEQNNTVESESREYERKLEFLALDKELKDCKNALENERLESKNLKTELGDSEVLISELQTHVETIAKSEKTTGVSMSGVRAMLASQQLKYEMQISKLNKVIDKLKAKVTIKAVFLDPLIIKNCIKTQKFFSKEVFLPTSVELFENGCQFNQNYVEVSSQTVEIENSIKNNTCDLHTETIFIVPEVLDPKIDQTTQIEKVNCRNVSLQTETLTRHDFQKSTKLPHPPNKFAEIQRPHTDTPSIPRPQTDTAPFDSDDLNSNSDIETLDTSLWSSRHDHSKALNFHTPGPNSISSRPRSASISRYNTGSPKTDFNPLHSFITPIPIPHEKKMNSRPVLSTWFPDNGRRPFSATGHQFLANSVGYGRMLHYEGDSDDSPLFSRVRKNTRPKTNEASSHFSDMRYPSVARVRNPTSARQNPSTLLESVSSGRRKNSRYQDLQKKTPAQREMEEFIDKLYDGN